MNKLEKLQEATIKALQGKLNESITWKRDIHDTNYDYGTDKDGKYGKINYPDTIYDFGTIIIDGNKYTITHTIDDYKNPQFNGKYHINPVKPYDNSNYHWAVSADNESYKIMLDNKCVEVTQVNDISNDDEIEEIIKLLIQLDKEANIKPSTAIW